VSGEEGRKTRILLADGHHMVRQGIRRLLESEADFEVVGESDNGSEVVRLARELKPHVIVMEARMPKLDSVDVIKRIKAEHPEATILVLTSHDEEECLELLRAGAGGYLLKSAKGEELAQTIRMVRAGQFVCDPLVEKRLLKHAVRPQPVALDFGQHLTRRETEVLKLAARGMGNRDIAGYLGLAERTVKGHLMSIFSKLGVGSRTEAVHEALKRGWVSLEDE
jgi:DNA-binding NarL/FixJ family response regulator